MKKECFEEFLTTHEKRIFRYLMGITGNEHDAMDLVQAVFIAITRSSKASKNPPRFLIPIELPTIKL
jgi:DNA-directed RNA polymerase specialized sigma24 family protein